jgi:hypothetical protein
MSDLDDKLLAFLEEQQEEKKRGITLEKFYTSLSSVANALAAHEKQDQEFRALVMEQHTSVNRRLTHVEGDLETLRVNVGHPSQRPMLSPMPDEENSRVDLVVTRAEVKDEVRHGVHRLAAETPGPGVGSAEQVVELVDSVLDDKLRALEEKRNLRREQERLAAFDAEVAEKARQAEVRRLAVLEEKKLSRQRRLNSIASIVVAITITVLTAVFGAMYSAARHETGVAEGKASVPVMVYSSLPTAVATSAPVTAASASAAVPSSSPAHR